MGKKKKVKRIKRKIVKVKVDENKEEDNETKAMENRLTVLKDTSCKLQQRLENIAQTLQFPNTPRVSYFADAVDEIECNDPNFIEPMQCQKEINKVNSVFDKLQKQIGVSEDEQHRESKILNIYATDLMYSKETSH